MFAFLHRVYLVLLCKQDPILIINQPEKETKWSSRGEGHFLLSPATPSLNKHIAIKNKKQQVNLQENPNCLLASTILLHYCRF